MRAATVFASALLAGACANVAKEKPSAGLDELRLDAVEPQIWLPGTQVLLSGKSFVGLPAGEPRLALRGTLGEDYIDFEIGRSFVVQDTTKMSFPAPIDIGDHAGTFKGELVLIINSSIDGQAHEAPPLAITLQFKKELTPTVRMIGAPSYVNDPITVQGSNFLLWSYDSTAPGGALGEGKTVAVLSGCFKAMAATECSRTVSNVEVPALPRTPYDRSTVLFPYATKISGIGPGSFTGKVELRNVHASGKLIRKAAPLDVSWQLAAPRLNPLAQGQTLKGSLGQYIFFAGGGFVGPRDEDDTTHDEATALRIDEGTFTPLGTTGGRNLAGIRLFPLFADGRKVKYIVNPQDALGSAEGLFAGKITPIISKGDQEVEGTPALINLSIEPVKQVVWVRFEPTYVHSLDLFGMRAADAALRKRMLAVAEKAYQGVNIEFRTTMPLDFHLYSTVDVSGADPSRKQNRGFDNSPGKDVNNLRLFDQVGGFYAKAQSDGSLGYGGIFVEEMLYGFSEHPPDEPPGSMSTPMFDLIFDPFRPDFGGMPIMLADLDGVAELKSGDGCPADEGDRRAQVACAIFTFGNMVGSTLAHEVGHSLGLAHPEVPGDVCVHSVSSDGDDAPNRLMDPGQMIPFEEKAELAGQGPASFCQAEYDYLRRILKSSAPAARVKRPDCGKCTAKRP